MEITSKEKSILIVEDSSLTRFTVKKALKEKGYLIEEASSGEEALNKVSLKPDAFALLIIDIHLPGLNGLELLKKIKELPRYRHIPVMMLTGETNITLVRRTIELGAVDYLSKPFSMDELERRIMKLIGPGISKTQLPLQVLHNLLKKEINRAKRGNLQLALVLAKQEIPAAEQLDELDNYIQYRLRDIDTVIELSDRFLAMVLPFSGKEGADIVVEKLVNWLPGKWSFSIAIYPHHGEDENTLFDYAQGQLLKIEN